MNVGDRVRYSDEYTDLTRISLGEASKTLGGAYLLWVMKTAQGTIIDLSGTSPNHVFVRWDDRKPHELVRLNTDVLVIALPAPEAKPI